MQILISACYPFECNPTAIRFYWHENLYRRLKIFSETSFACLDCSLETKSLQ